MPVKSNIELGSGSLYFKGIDEPFEIHDCEATYEPEYVDDQEPYIKISQEPVEFTISNADFPRDWTLVKCSDCGYEFPVTEFYALLYGPTSWICPMCALKKTIEDARKRSNE